MIVEVGVVICALFQGHAVLTCGGPVRSLHVRQSLKLITGMAITTISIVVGVLLSIPYWLSVFLLGLLALIGLVRFLTELRSFEALVALRTTCVTVAALVGSVLLARILNGARSTADSYEYVVSGTLIASDSVDLASTQLLETRMLGYSALQSLANYADELYLTAFSTIAGVLALLLAGAAFASMLEIEISVQRRGLIRQTRVLIVGGSIAFGLTTGFYLWSSLYINSHTYVAALFAGLLYLMVIQRIDQNKCQAAASGVLSVAITLTRPEGFLLVFGLGVLFLAAETGRNKAAAISLISASGAACLWWVFLALRDDPTNGDLTTLRAVGYGLAPAVLSGSAFLGARTYSALRLRGRAVWPGFVMSVALIGLLTAALLQPAITRKITSSFFENYLIGEGLWGKTLVVLLAINVCACASSPLRKFRQALMVIPTSLVLLTCTGYIRGGGFRVGPGDSFNRMLVHLFPVICAAGIFSVVALLIRQDRSADECLPEGNL